MATAKRKSDEKNNDDTNNSEYQVSSCRVSARAKSKLMQAAAAQTVSFDVPPEPKSKPEPKPRPSEAKSGKPVTKVNSRTKMTDMLQNSSHRIREYRDDSMDRSNDSVESISSADSESSSDDIDMENWSNIAHGYQGKLLTTKSQLMVPKDKYSSRAVVRALTWDFWSLPPTNNLAGKVTPKFLKNHKHRRKCSVEIHRVTTIAPEGDESYAKKIQQSIQKPSEYSYYECFVRILVPANRELKKKFNHDARKKLADRINTHDRYSIVEPIGLESFDDDDNDDNNSVHSASYSSNTASRMKDVGGRKFAGWNPRYSIPISGISPLSRNKKRVTILIKHKSIEQQRVMIFDTADDAESFMDYVEIQKRDEEKRQNERLNYALGGEITIHNFERLSFLFEIVSAYDLPIGDITSSDPYVCAYLGLQEVHRTSYKANTLNPVWTLKTGSLFLLTVESRQFFIEQGLKFVVKDYDQVGKDDTLGVCRVGPKVLFQANGERMEFNLSSPQLLKKKKKSGKTKSFGSLVIRCRRATQYDLKFMEDFDKQTRNTTGVASYIAPKTDTNAFKTITTKIKRKGPGGVFLYKTRPFPDPRQNPEKTEWMTYNDIEKVVLEPSHQWVEMSEGTLGKIYLEILQCDELPNLDLGSFYGNKTDAFVSVVYEDAYGMTDVISDCLSPRWLPWSNRAFILNISHPSTVLNIGIFDYDAGSKNMFNHDLIGRVSVDLTNLRSSTEYVLSYEICRSARVSSDRGVYGKLKIRLRMEIPDERRLAFAALYPPPPFYVNTKNLKDYRVIRKTVFGSVEENQYSVATLKSFIDEICELKIALSYLSDAAMMLLLWRRGQCTLRIPMVGSEIDLPLHSLILFLTITFVVEYPQLIPASFFGAIAWLILAINGYRMGSENVWWRCHSYSQIFKMITLGDDYVKPHKIEQFENYEKAKEESEEQIRRIEAGKKKTPISEEMKALKKEQKKELAEFEDIVGPKLSDQLATKLNVGGLATHGVVGSVLHPIQLMLSIVLRGVRIAKNILLWQEAYLSFWVTTGMLVLSILSLFVPWMWCLKWGSRIFVWTFCGPWMKLLDIYYFELINPETEEQRQRRKHAKFVAKELSRSKTLVQVRIDRENMMKQKAMKKYMFGRYQIRVPILKQDRYPDIPLADSFAIPYREKEVSLAELAMHEAGYNTKRIQGQRLIGDMIPYVKDYGFTQAPTGKVALHMEKLSKDAPGGGMVTKPSKILTMVFLAVGVSYIGTPLMARVMVQTNDWITALLPLTEQETEQEEKPGMVLIGDMVSYDAVDGLSLWT